MNLSNMPAALFSPAKMAFVGYILLTSLDRIDTSFAQFVVVSAVFLLVQVFHDDYLRIRLNQAAASNARR